MKAAEGTEVIQHRHEVQEIFVDMIKSAEHEVLLVIPTINSFYRKQRLGILQLLKYGAIEHEIKIRILTPVDSEVLNVIQGIIEEIGEIAKENFHLRAVDVMYQESSVDSATILIVDKKVLLTIEKLEDIAENFLDAVGLASYSNSKPTVSSYLSIFESLWNQVKLYEELKKHDKMQQEFINIAAHELRTPAQSILGYAELAKSDTKYTEKQIQSFIDVVYRNAYRIQRLTEDILDVTRIESQTLTLSKTRFNLTEVVLSASKDVQVRLVSDASNKVKIVYEGVGIGMLGEGSNNVDDIFVEADRNRITQVISNLLDNALKFTPQGLVSVTVERNKDQIGTEEAIVCVEDTGSGIDPEIFPRLFTKFSSRSFRGTGLGLYISKNIIDAHGGKIWGKNNDDHVKKSGAKFCFSLPVTREMPRE